ncbi:iron-containing alcohol dehydrogenase family protein [Sporosarcina sp. 179-K 3D1 HS]|uniref:iron-containing alcohol dehydrogenase family protein n=1 Tax=Sporosarcina sp. 179-K 3D1 HS TaxID=3232169 RepID=UPI0039A33B7C
MILSQRSFSLAMPTTIIFGKDSVKHNLSSKIKEFQKSNVFIATDPGIVQAGIIETVQSVLQENGIDSIVFSEVEPNPHSDTVMKGLKLYKEQSCDMILAIGGGSAMDFGKAVGAIAAHTGHVLEYQLGKKPIVNELPFLICISTTVGTGSEVTAVAVITDPEVGRKFVLGSPLLLPKIALIDPELTKSLPAHIVSTTGIDALVHAIEAYTSINSNPVTDGLALQAIKMIKNHLPASYAQPENLEARAQVHLASTLAGAAFGIAGVGLVHLCSHPMSALYQVPHGLANAVLLPHVLDFNVIANYEKYADIARIFNPSLVLENDITAAEELANIIDQFNRSLNIPEDFSFTGKLFTDEMIERLANDAVKDLRIIPYNARKVRKEDVVALYKKVLPPALVREKAIIQ